MRLQPLPALGDNYIWVLRDADAGTAVAVDPGEAGPLLQAVEAGLPLDALLLTHHHDDHIGGVGALRERLPGLRVLAPDDTRIALATDRVRDGDEVRTGAWRFCVLAIPGHTRSHVAFAGDDVLFCGDTLFSLGCGRMFEGTPMQMLASLDRLAALPGHLQVCCGHEYTLANAAFALVVEPDNPALRERAAQVRAQRDDGRPTLPSTLEGERAANPFLRVDAPGVRAAVAARLGRTPADRVEAFAELRHWKDGFRA